MILSKAHKYTIAELKNTEMAEMTEKEFNSLALKVINDIKGKLRR
jgi:hypothetical protein